jgi:hypothetical protein
VRDSSKTILAAIRSHGPASRREIKALCPTAPSIENLTPILLRLVDAGVLSLGERRVWSSDVTRIPVYQAIHQESTS